MLKLTIPTIEAPTKDDLVLALKEVISGIDTGYNGGDINNEVVDSGMWSLTGEQEINASIFAERIGNAINDYFFEDDEFDVKDLLNINDNDTNLVVRRDHREIFLLSGMRSEHAQFTVLISSIDVDEDEVSRKAYQSMYEQLDLGENFDQVDIDKMIETSHMDSLLEYKNDHTAEAIKSKIENYDWEDWAESNRNAANDIAKAFSWI